MKNLPFHYLSEVNEIFASKFHLKLISNETLQKYLTSIIKSSKLISVDARKQRHMFFFYHSENRVRYS